VIIAIVYYLHDIPKYKRIQAEMSLCAYCTIGIIQNISQNRSNKRITQKDLSHARCLAALSAYPGNSAYAVSGSATGARRPTASFYLLYLYHIKGTGHNKCKICWCWDSSYMNTSPNLSISSVFFTADKAYSSVIYKEGDDVNSQEIYPSLTIEAGEEKMILDSCYWAMNTAVFADGRSAATVPLGRRFGLYVAIPKPPKVGGQGYFNSVVIFTPNPGLFSESRPSAD
jgi:hypothetical protein